MTRRVVDAVQQGTLLGPPTRMSENGEPLVDWLLWNTGRLGIKPVHPYPFGLTTTILSLETIFLSIFVLMSQQRAAAIAELREELGRQVGLRVEHELTKTLQLVAGLSTRLGHRVSHDPELAHMLRPLDATRGALKPRGALLRRIVRS